MSSAVGPPGTGGLGGAVAAARERFRSVGIVRVIIAITLVAIAARVVLLGARTAHWDEARVAYWIVHTLETGDFAYRRIIHGPLIQHVNRWLFAVVGPSDFLMRLPVAVVGGLLPLSVLLLREHLDDDELVILALFLGFNAVLVYYSRFMRSDVLVAAFMFVGLGCIVRFYDTRRWRYVYGLGLATALGFAAKENALVYVLTWAGAAALLADQALYRPRNYTSGYALLRASWLARLGGRLRALPWQMSERLRGDGTHESLSQRLSAVLSDARDPGTVPGQVTRWLLHPIGALLVFLVVIVFLYAPRGAGEAGLYYPPGSDAAVLGLWEAVGRPTALPGFALDTLADTAGQFAEWITQSSDPSCRKDNIIDGWLCFLGQFLDVMRDHAFLLSGSGLLGLVYERYGRARSRNLVMFAGYAGVVSVLGYPLGTDVFGAWIVVHAIVPLAIPAAVGLAAVYRWGRDAALSGDDVGAAVVGLILILLVAQVGVSLATGVYINDTDYRNSLVQYAQPGDDLDPMIAAMERAAAESDSGPDVVLYYGETGDNRSERRALVATEPGWREGDLLTKPACAEWFNALPLPWYFQTTGVNVTCETESADLASQAGPTGPGVIITVSNDQTVPVEALRSASYGGQTYRLRSTGAEVTVYIHERLAKP
ncbi:MAG: flippase activity-associated protein Agl23 [Salinirussus sp.]